MPNMWQLLLMRFVIKSCGDLLSVQVGRGRGQVCQERPHPGNSSQQQPSLQACNCRLSAQLTIPQLPECSLARPGVTHRRVCYASVYCGAHGCCMGANDLQGRLAAAQYAREVLLRPLSMGLLFGAAERSNGWGTVA